MSSTRQLTAIMPARRNPEWDEGGFTDIVGYTSLMGADERKAMEFKEIKQMFEERNNRFKDEIAASFSKGSIN